MGKDPKSKNSTGFSYNSKSNFNNKSIISCIRGKSLTYDPSHNNKSKNDIGTDKDIIILQKMNNELNNLKQQQNYKNSKTKALSMNPNKKPSKIDNYFNDKQQL